MPYLLDTDSVSLAFGGNESIRSRIRQKPDIYLSSIAAEDRVRGALSLIQRSRDAPGLPAAQSLLARVLYDIADYRIHVYNEEAVRVYASLRRS